MQQWLTPPSGNGRVIRVRAVHVHMCLPVSASLRRLLAQVTGEVTATSPPSPGALRCRPPRWLSALCLVLLGTVPASSGHSGQSHVRLGGT